MPRTRRYIKARGIYEITFRARNTLPFPCTRIMEVLVYSVLSRVQHGGKVVLHQYFVEGSHIHIICTAKDAYQCQRFYGEIKKQLTDAIKCLTGLKHLILWKKRANVSEIATLEDAIAKIAYIYANPSNDDLVQCIDDYPGVSSWKAFKGCPMTVDACVSSSYEWIQQPMIPKLPSRSISACQDGAIVKEMLSLAKEKHELKLQPNSWISRFVQNASTDEVADINNRICSHIRELEEANAKRRKSQGKGIVGASALRNQPLLKPHVSKKQGRRIFVQSRVRDVRLALIREMKLIDALCREAYRNWVKGNFRVSWPPGTFPPPLPQLASALPYI